MARRRNLCKKMHAKKIRNAREKLALFRQGKLPLAQLPALARRILEKGMRASQGVMAPPKEKAAAPETPRPSPAAGASSPA